MPKKFRSEMRRPSPAFLLAAVALFVALGGTSYAAIKLPKNSVGATQIRANAVGASEIKQAAVRSSEVKNGSLGGADVAAGTFLGDNVTTQHTIASSDLVDGTSQNYDVHCPEGQVALGGGARGDATDSEATNVGSSRPVTSPTVGAPPLDDGTFTGWRATVLNPLGGVSSGIRPEVWVVCAAP